MQLAIAIKEIWKSGTGSFYEKKKMSKNQKLFETRRSSVPFAIYAFVYDRKSNIFFSFWHNNCSRVFATTAISPSTLLTGVLLLTNLVSLISLNPVLFRLSVASLNLLSVPFRMISARSPFLRSPSCPSRHVPKLFLLVQNLLSSQLPSSRADLFCPSPISVRGPRIIGPQTILDILFSGLVPFGLLKSIHRIYMLELI